MKKRILLYLCILSVMIMLCSCKIPFFNNNKDNADKQIPSDMEDIEYQDDIDPTETTISTNESETEVVTTYSDGGGMSKEKIKMEVTVSEDKYFFDKKTISFDDLISEIDSQRAENEIVVYIIEDNSTLKTYKKLIDYLTEKEIDFTEK